MGISVPSRYRYAYHINTQTARQYNGKNLDGDNPWQFFPSRLVVLFILSYRKPKIPSSSRYRSSWSNWIKKIGFCCPFAPFSYEQTAPTRENCTSNVEGATGISGQTSLALRYSNGRTVNIFHVCIQSFLFCITPHPVPTENERDNLLRRGLLNW